MRKIFVLLAVSLLSTPAFALDQDDQDALDDTKALLKDQAALKAFTKDNKDAAGALDQVKVLTKGNKEQAAEVNEIASAQFEKMIKAHNGDVAGAMEELQKGLADPAGFLKNMPPELQERVHKLGAEIDKNSAEAPRKPASPEKTK